MCRGVIMVGAVLCLLATLGVAATMAQMARPRVSAAPSPTLLVTEFVRSSLWPQVWTIEMRLAGANQSLLAYCGVPGMDVTSCADLTAHWGRLTHTQLHTLLLQEAQALTNAGHNLAQDNGPLLSLYPTRHLERANEDLALAGDQAAALLMELASVGPTTDSPTSSVLATTAQRTAAVAYGPRLRSILALLHRAEAWLETVDRETGARAYLPGLGQGAPLLERQLGVQ